MSGAKEIRTKIKSIKNTQKITRAREMVAASKMRKEQERMHAARPYSDKIRGVINHLAFANSEYKHSYLEDRDVKRVGFIIVSSDRDLCGGINNNLFRKTLNVMKEWQDKKIDVDLCTIGSKATSFFKSVSDIKASATHLGDTPSVTDIIGTVKVMLDAYDNGEIDRLFVVYNRFVNTMTQDPTVLQMLPVTQEEEDKELVHHWDYIYEPDAKVVLDGLLIRYIESQVYQGVIENIACEMAARMVAMKAATDNAGDLIGDLETGL